METRQVGAPELSVEAASLVRPTGSGKLSFLFTLCVLSLQVAKCLLDAFVIKSGFEVHSWGRV